MAMTETSLRQPLRYTIDLGAGLVQQPMRSQLMKGDKKANRVIVHLTDGGKDVTLSGVTVTGSFIRPPDAAEIPLTGETSGSEAIVTLDDACYSTEGYCEISVKLTVGETSRTILTLTGYVLSKGSGAYVDVSGVIPNIDDVIAQYAEMKRVTQETQAAGTAAGNAAGAANTAAGAANAQAQAAQRAAAAADTAASKIDGLTVSAEEADEAGAEVSQKDGAYHVNFKLPKGDTGATPDITFEVATGAAGSDVQLEQSGTPEAPHIKLTIPRGDTGAVEGVDYYEGNPKALGEASPGTANGVARGDHVHPKPTPEDIGAAAIDDITPRSKTTYSSEKIEGELSSLSQQIENVGTPNLLVNSNFQSPYLINLLGLTEYSGGSGITPIVDGWEKDATMTVEIVGDGLKLTNTAASGRTAIYRRAKIGLFKPNTTYTLAAKLNKNIVCGTVTTGSDLTVQAQYDYNHSFGTLRLQTTGVFDSFIVIIPFEATGTIEWAVLYEGSYTAETLPTPIWLHPRLEMIRMGLPVNPVNLLDNSYFIEPVNQRGKTTYTQSDLPASGYTIDRWRMNVKTGVFTIGNGYIRLEDSETNNNHFRQHVNLKVSKDTVFTFAAKARGENFGLCYFGSSAKFQSANNWTIVTYIYTVPAGTNLSANAQYNPLFTWNKGGWIEIEWAAMYEGAYTLETLPTYRPKGYSVELAECQKYFWEANPRGNYYTQLGVGIIASNIRALVLIDLPVDMRYEGNKSLAYSSLDDLMITSAAGNVGGITKVTLDASSDYSKVKLEINGSDFTAGEACILYLKNNGRLSISKDL